MFHFYHGHGFHDQLRVNPGARGEFFAARLDAKMTIPPVSGTLDNRELKLSNQCRELCPVFDKRACSGYAHLW